MVKNEKKESENLKFVREIAKQDIADKKEIKIIGIGGGGINAIKRMIKSGLKGDEFWAVDTDLKNLKSSKIKNKLQLGIKVTEGLGSGCDPKLGKQAAEENQQYIKTALKGADMIFIVAGIGGGTGTGAAPVVAKIAKELGILTIAVVTKPFSWEGRKRQNQAEQGLDKLRECVDAAIVVPNDELFQIVNRQVSLTESFLIVDEILLRGVQCISDIITIPGMINVDFADIKSVMLGSGSMLMGIGRAQGEGRAIKAAEIAINSPLLESSIDKATSIIVNITGGIEMTLHEISDVATVVQNAVTENTVVLVGDVIKEDTQNEIKVTVIATGVNR